MAKSWKEIENAFKLNAFSQNPNVIRVKELLTKYNINYRDFDFDLGCPWVVDPLNKTEAIKFEWSNQALINVNARADKNDKTYRFNEALNALEAINNFVSGNIEQGKQLYIGLGIYGRVMFINAAKQQSSEVAEYLLETASHFASENFDPNSTVFIKALGVTAGDMFNKYIKPILSKYTDEELTNFSSNNNSNNSNYIEERKKVDKNNEEKIVITKYDYTLLQNAAEGSDISNRVKQAVRDFEQCVFGNNLEVNQLTKGNLDSLYQHLYDVIKHDDIPDDAATYHAVLTALSVEYPD